MKNTIMDGEILAALNEKRYGGDITATQTDYWFGAYNNLIEVKDFKSPFDK